MNILALFSTIVVAAEVVISPLASDYNKPTTSLSNLRNGEAILGISSMIATPSALIIAGDGTIDASASSRPIVTPTPEIVPSPTPTPTVAITPTPAVSKNFLRKSVTVALLGDSMMDTLGPFPELETALNETYPNISVTILNYGVGGTNIDYGIERITHGYEYLGKQIPALSAVSPDIVVVESFGYNPYSFDTGAIDKHWMALAKAVDSIKETMPRTKIVLAATIAPNANVFANGAPGVSFSPEGKRKHVETIKAYLESTTRFAVGQRYPLADAYHASLQADGNGDISYINAGDHIHTSPEGRAFFAKVLAKTLIDQKILGE